MFTCGEKKVQYLTGKLSWTGINKSSSVMMADGCKVNMVESSESCSHCVVCYWCHGYSKACL